MKKTALFFCIFVLTLLAMKSYGQSPESFNYQAVVRGSDGAILIDEPVTMRFTIRTGSATGPVQYQETVDLETSPYGVVSHMIGEGDPASGSMGSITWGAASKFLSVDIEEGSNYVSLGTQQLVSVPYALHAKVAEEVEGGLGWNTSGSNLYNTNSGSVGVGTSSPIQKLDISGRLNVNNGVIQRGGSAITATSDLGLYSRVSGNWMRLVTNEAPIQFFTAEGENGIGENIAFEISGNASDVGYWTQLFNYSIENAIRPSTNAFGYVGHPDRIWYRIYSSTYYGNNTSIQSLSDRSLKTNVAPINSALTSLMLLRPVNYDIIPEKMYPNKDARDKIDGRDLYDQMGFIAQEVEEVYPQLVREMEREDGTLKTVGYAGLIPVMVKSIQEQQAQIEALQAEIEALKTNSK